MIRLLHEVLKSSSESCRVSEFRIEGFALKDCSSCRRLDGILWPETVFFGRRVEYCDCAGCVELS